MTEITFTCNKCGAEHQIDLVDYIDINELAREHREYYQDLD
mgnify:CR=1 FL=1